jgi:hypothetical protein
MPTKRAPAACPVEASPQATRMRRLRESRKEQNLCPECGDPLASPDDKQCGDCNHMAKHRMRRLRRLKSSVA